MSPRRYLSLVLLLAAIATGALILSGGYYETPGKLVRQALLIGVPIFVPLALLAGAGRASKPGMAIVGAILAIGWGYVAYADSRADSGGGASLAVVMGWAASAVAALVALPFWILGARK